MKLALVLKHLPMLVALAIAADAAAAPFPPPLPPPPSPEAKMAWFREAKYGLFIHWGLFAIPAGQWHGKWVRPSSEWVMAHAKVPVKEYEQLAAQFNPVEFNADQWVQMAVDAGMKYIVITAKHGDGFAMYHSQVSRYNIYDATPFHRDPIRELAEACAAHHLKFGFYYSQSVDWHEPGGVGNNWDFEADSAKNKDGAYDDFLRNKCEPQVKELLSNYGPVCELFFDTPSNITVERGDRFVQLVHALQPACLIDGRLGVPGDYLTMGDNGIPSADVGGDWETPATVNHNWGYATDDPDWKSPSQILFNLVDIVSKGGNYLLNVGPTSKGVVPPVCVSNLLAVGDWLKTNGEAIYGVKASPFAEGFKNYGKPWHNDDGNTMHVPLTAWRCTAAPGKLYFTIFNWPGSSFRLPDFKNNIRKVYLLSDPDKTDMPVRTSGGAREVETPHYAPHVIASVLAVEIDGNVVR